VKARTFGYFFKESCRSIGRNGLMSLAAATTIIISLLIMGVFMILITNLNYVGEQAKSQIQLRIFLQENLPFEQAMALRDEIARYKSDGVRSVRFKSKQEVAVEVERTWKLPEFFTSGDDNPLPDMIQVELDRGAKIEQLIDKIKVLPGVSEIVYLDFIRTMLLVVQILWVVGLALILVVSLGVLYIIVNTVRLTVFARRREIEIMKLVGATDWFIRWPLILEGMLLGIVGAVLATVALSKGYYFLFKSVRQITVIPLVPEPRVNGLLLMCLFPAGILFGTLGSILSIKRFLKE
jgi:cell division transport system permease protein